MKFIDRGLIWKRWLNHNQSAIFVESASITFDLRRFRRVQNAHHQAARSPAKHNTTTGEYEV